MSKYSSAADPQYGVWDDIHARKAPEDRERNEWLAKKIKEYNATPGKRGRPPKKLKELL